MQIHLSPRNVRLTGAIHGYVAEKIMCLEDIASQVRAAHVVLLHDEKTASGGIFIRKRKTHPVDKRRKFSPNESRQ